MIGDIKSVYGTRSQTRAKAGGWKRSNHSARPNSRAKCSGKFDRGPWNAMETWLFRPQLILPNPSNRSSRPSLSNLCTSQRSTTPNLPPVTPKSELSLLPSVPHLKLIHRSTKSWSGDDRHLQLPCQSCRLSHHRGSVHGLSVTHKTCKKQDWPLHYTMDVKGQP